MYAEMYACPGTVVLSLVSSQSLELSSHRSSSNLLFIRQSLVPLGPGESPCPVSMATAPPQLPFQGDLVSPSSKGAGKGKAEVSFLNLLSQPAHPVQPTGSPVVQVCS